MQKLLNSFFILLFIPAVGFSQLDRKDAELIMKTSFNAPAQASKPKFVQTSGSFIKRYNPVTLGFGAMLYVYQVVLSPQISSKCSYEVSCSNFSKRCIQQYGLIRGVALSADRLTRCNRVAAFDISMHDLLDNYKIKDDPERYHLD